MAVVTKNFDASDEDWVDGCVEIMGGQAVKLLDDPYLEKMWRISVDGVEGIVPSSCVLSTSSGRSGNWGSTL